MSDQDETKFDPLYTTAELALLTLRLTIAMQQVLRYAKNSFDVNSPRPSEALLREHQAFIMDELPALETTLSDCRQKAKSLTDDLVKKLLG